jgi:hypothetical protein
MKIRVCLALTVVCAVIAAASCGTKADGAAYETYREIVGVIRGDSPDARYDVDATIDTRVDYAGQSVTASVGGNVKVTDEDGVKRYDVSMDMGEYGVLEARSDGEIVHCTVNGEERYISRAELETQIASVVNAPDVGKKAVKESSAAEISGGSEYTLLLDGTQLTDFATELLGEELETFGVDAGGTPAVDDVGVVITCDASGVPQRMTIELRMTVPVNGEEAEISAGYLYVFGEFSGGVSSG